MRVVLDTNVIISALLVRGSIPHEILNASTEGRFEVIVSGEILRELTRVLFYPRIRQKRWMTDKEVRGFILSLANSAVRASGTFPMEVVEDDPGDDKFVAAAVEQGADYVVSGDAHLTGIGKYRGVKFLTPAQFYELLRRADHSENKT